MKHKVRDDEVELFGWREPEHVAPFEINSVRKAKDPRVLICPLEARPFKAGVLERVNPSYLGVPIEFSTNTAQEAKAAAHVENSQFVISLKWKRSEGISEYSLYYCTCLLGSCCSRMVVGSKVWFLPSISSPRMCKRTRLIHSPDGRAPNIYFCPSQ